MKISLTRFGTSYLRRVLASAAALGERTAFIFDSIGTRRLCARIVQCYKIYFDITFLTGNNFCKFTYCVEKSINLTQRRIINFTKKLAESCL